MCSGEIVFEDLHGVLASTGDHHLCVGMMFQHGLENVAHGTVSVAVQILVCVPTLRPRQGVDQRREHRDEHRIRPRRSMEIDLYARGN